MACFTGGTQVLMLNHQKWFLCDDSVCDRWHLLRRKVATELAISHLQPQLALACHLFSDCPAHLQCSVGRLLRCVGWQGGKGNSTPRIAQSNWVSSSTCHKKSCSSAVLAIFLYSRFAHLPAIQQPKDPNRKAINTEHNAHPPLWERCRVKWIGRKSGA